MCTYLDSLSISLSFLLLWILIHYVTKTSASIGLNSSPKSYGSWTDLIQAESQCIDSQFITIESFLGVVTSRTFVISRWLRSCPLTGAQFDIQSRHTLLIITHPRYRVSQCLKSATALKKFAAEIKRSVHSFLRQTEGVVFVLAFGTNTMPKKFNYMIPTLFGDSGLFADTKPLKHKIFYALIRLAVNSYRSQHGLIFFTSPNYSGHMSATRELIGSYFAVFAGVLESNNTQYLDVAHRLH